MRRTALLALLAAAACTSELQQPLGPRARLEDTEITLAEGVDTASVMLYNEGGSELDWSVLRDQSWLTVTPAEGLLAGADSQRIALRVDAAAAPIGANTATVVIESNSFVQRPQLTIAFDNPAVPVATLVEADTIMVYPGSGEFRVANTGRGPLDFTVTAEGDLAWRTYFQPQQGRLQTGGSTTVRIDLSPWPEQDDSLQVRVVSNSIDGPLTFTLRVLAAPAP